MEQKFISKKDSKNQTNIQNLSKGTLETPVTTPRLKEEKFFTVQKFNTLSKFEKIDSAFFKKDDKENSLRPIEDRNFPSFTKKNKVSSKISKRKYGEEILYKQTFQITDPEKESSVILVKGFIDSDIKRIGKNAKELEEDFSSEDYPFDEDIDSTTKSVMRGTNRCLLDLEEGILAELKDTNQIEENDNRKLREIMESQFKKGMTRDLSLRYEKVPINQEFSNKQKDEQINSKQDLT